MGGHGFLFGFVWGVSCLFIFPRSFL